MKNSVAATRRDARDADVFVVMGGGVKCRVVKSEGSKSLSEQIHASWHVSFGASKGDLQ